jgi:hypothetical protein
MLVAVVVMVIKVKITPQHTTKAQWGSRGIAPPMHNLGARWGRR